MSDAPGSVEAAAFNGAAVTFMNEVPQPMASCWAAGAYVLLSGWVELLAKLANIAIVSWRHELHVGRDPPGSCWPMGR